MTIIEASSDAEQRLKRAEQHLLEEVGVPWGGVPSVEQRAAVIAKLQQIVSNEFSQSLQERAASHEHPLDGLSWSLMDQELRDLLFQPHRMKRLPFRM